MPTYALFLRGINVGGIRIAMKDLAEALTAAGYTRVSTLLASGNVVLDAGTGDAAALKADVEAVLRARFGYEAWVIVVPPERLAAIVDAYPFPAVDDGIQRHDYVVFAAAADAVAHVLGADPVPVDGERFAAGDQVLYWQVPRGSSLDTPLARELGRARHKPVLTTRNLNTLHKVLARAGA
ncbi:DUF1697 domain-containing protein [Arthrobacter sp. JSM 101049]|uniref:DUF1697 domain-containing protein n=1 Tax=Arthrobacter sp. JSM 101049 TaxID=929097 RepID=UPI00356309CB